MKLYTRTGDGGSTGLYGADRVRKTDPRVEAYGTVDELSSVLGLVRAHNAATPTPDAALDADLAGLQNDLYELGADLATRAGGVYEKNISRMDAEDSAALEALIDRYQAEAQPLRSFLHPGGTLTASTLQLARAVARRAEREVIRLLEVEEANPHAQVYLNRLSDLLFIMARVVNERSGVPEEAWLVRKRR